MSQTALTLGMTVTKFNGRGEPTNILKVHRVTTRFAELSDGTKWALNGNDTYPKSSRGSWTSTGCVLPTTKEHGDMLKRRRVLRRIESMRWDELPDETLIAIGKLIPESKRSQ